MCCVPGCQSGPIHFAHVRSARNSGVSVKPPDWDGVSLCAAHHQEQHEHGVETFERNHKIDLFKIASEFAHKSPDLKMRCAMGEWGA